MLETLMLIAIASGLISIGAFGRACKHGRDCKRHTERGGA